MRKCYRCGQYYDDYCPCYGWDSSSSSSGGNFTSNYTPVSYKPFTRNCDTGDYTHQTGDVESSTPVNSLFQVHTTTLTDIVDGEIVFSSPIDVYGVYFVSTHFSVLDFHLTFVQYPDGTIGAPAPKAVDLIVNGATDEYVVHPSVFPISFGSSFPSEEFALQTHVSKIEYLGELIPVMNSTTIYIVYLSTECPLAEVPLSGALSCQSSRPLSMSLPFNTSSFYLSFEKISSDRLVLYNLVENVVVPSGQPFSAGLYTVQTIEIWNIFRIFFHYQNETPANEVAVFKLILKIGEGEFVYDLSDLGVQGDFMLYSPYNVETALLPVVVNEGPIYVLQRLFQFQIVCSAGVDITDLSLAVLPGDQICIREVVCPQPVLSGAPPPGGVLTILSNGMHALPYNDFFFPYSTDYLKPYELLDNDGNPCCTNTDDGLYRVPFQSAHDWKEILNPDSVLDDSRVQYFPSPSAYRLDFGRFVKVMGVYIYFRTTFRYVGFSAPGTVSPIRYLMRLLNETDGTVKDLSFELYDNIQDPVYYIRAEDLPGTVITSLSSAPVAWGVRKFWIARDINNTTTDLVYHAVSHIRLDLKYDDCTPVRGVRDDCLPCVLPESHPFQVIAPDGTIVPDMISNEWKWFMKEGSANLAENIPSNSRFITPTSTTVYDVDGTVTLFPPGDDDFLFDGGVDLTGHPNIGLQKTGNIRVKFEIPPWDDFYLCDCLFLNLFSQESAEGVSGRVHFISDVPDLDKYYWFDFRRDVISGLYDNIIQTAAEILPDTYDQYDVQAVAKRVIAFEIDMDPNGNNPRYALMPLRGLQFIGVQTKCSLVDLGIEEPPPPEFPGGPTNCNIDLPFHGVYSGQTAQVAAFANDPRGVNLLTVNDIQNYNFGSFGSDIGYFLLTGLDVDITTNAVLSFDLLVPQDVYLAGYMTTANAGLRSSIVVKLFNNKVDVAPVFQATLTNTGTNNLTDKYFCFVYSKYLNYTTTHDLTANAIARGIVRVEYHFSNISAFPDGWIRHWGGAMYVLPSNCVVPVTPPPPERGGPDNCQVDVPILTRFSGASNYLQTMALVPIPTELSKLVATDVASFTSPYGTLTGFLDTVSQETKILTSGDVVLTLNKSIDLYWFGYLFSNPSLTLTIKAFYLTTDTTPAYTYVIPAASSGQFHYEAIRSNYLPGTSYHDITANALFRRVSKFIFSFVGSSGNQRHFGGQIYYLNSVCLPPGSVVYPTKPPPPTVNPYRAYFANINGTIPDTNETTFYDALHRDKFGNNWPIKGRWPTYPLDTNGRRSLLAGLVPVTTGAVFLPENFSNGYKMSYYYLTHVPAGASMTFNFPQPVDIHQEIVLGRSETIFHPPTNMFKYYDGTTLVKQGTPVAGTGGPANWQSGLSTCPLKTDSDAHPDWPIMRHITQLVITGPTWHMGCCLVGEYTV